MKKRITLALALAAVISLSACGANGGTTETTTEAVQEQTTAAEKSEASEVSESESEVSTEETEAVTEIAPHISESEQFKNGSWLFKANTDEVNEYYICNLSEHNTFKINNDNFDIYDIRDISGSTIVSSKNIFNAETGEIYCDLSNKEPLYFMDKYENIYCFNNHKCFILNRNGSFTINEESSLGYLKDTGEWISDMSSDRSLFKVDSSNSGSPLVAGEDFIRIAVGFNEYLYDIYSDKMLCGDKITDNINLFMHSSNSDYCYFFLDSKGYVKYDINNDCIVDVITQNTETIKSYIKIENDDVIIPNVNDSFELNNKYTIINSATDVCANFDLSEYTSSNILCCNGNVVLATYSSDSNYVGIFDTNGKPMFDPIEGYVEEADIKESPNKFIICCNSEINFLYDIETNAVTTFNTDESSADFYRICDFDAETNTLLVQAKNPDDGNIYYYLADANDPMNYYNPLEK